jgi:pimeloyl-ACP methyl ester carboxylesterase
MNNRSIVVDKATENYLKLLDGRQLCYAEYGDPTGRPLFVFHGGANSRLLWSVIPGSPFIPNARLIAPDIPGFGRTDFVEGVTTLENWPHDVVALADSLGIDKFAVFGPSGGGPFALSCAWKIPGRLSAVGIFAGVGPLVPETVRGLAAPVRMMWSTAPKVPGLFKMQMRLFAWLARKYPKLYVRMIRGEFGETDRNTYDRLKLADVFQIDRNEGYRQGGVGSWYGAMIPDGWPIPLEEISAKIYLWQGEEDVSVPPAMGRYMAEKIPNCTAEFIRGAGHFWIMEHLPEMLAKLVDSVE